jgi:hypothetical protein
MDPFFLRLCATSLVRVRSARRLQLGLKLVHRGEKRLLQVHVVELREDAPKSVGEFVRKFGLSTVDLPNARLGHHPFHQVAAIANEALHDFLACPWSPSIGFFTRGKTSANLHCAFGQGGELNVPSVTRCAIADESRLPSRLPSASSAFRESAPTTITRSAGCALGSSAARFPSTRDSGPRSSSCRFPRARCRAAEIRARY